MQAVLFPDFQRCTQEFAYFFHGGWFPGLFWVAFQTVNVVRAALAHLRCCLMILDTNNPTLTCSKSVLNAKGLAAVSATPKQDHA
eukprot:4557744-Amphidinium_carterae.1